MKKIITIIAILIVLATIGIGGYFIWSYFTMSSQVSPVPAGTGAIDNATPITPSATSNTTIKLLADTAVAGYAQTGSKITAITPDGQVVEINGNDAQIINSSKLSENVLSVKVSYDGTWLLEKFGDKNHPKFSLYNVSSASWKPITDFDMSDADWSPNSNKLAFISSLGSNATIGILDLGKQTKTGFSREVISTLALEEANITWLTPNEILLSDPPSKYVLGSIWKYKIKEKTFTPLAYKKSGLVAGWSKTGSATGIIFTSTPKNNFSVVRGDGSIMVNINILTLPNKCTFQNFALVCAIPKNNLAAAILPDDYLKKALYTNDNFYKINVPTGEITPLLDTGSSKIDAVNLTISGSRLLFINRLDQKLYSIDVP